MVKKNVIWIFGDQHRAQALGCNGNKDIQTPNLDEIAKNGVNFNKAVAGFPLCCPFRGSLLTSKYPHQDGAVPGHQYRMDPNAPTIAKIFNEAGYDTAYFGKWHVDGYKEEKGGVSTHIVPPNRRGGFKVWMGYENNNKQWDTYVHGFDGGKEVKPYKLPDFETNELTNLLIKYLKNIPSHNENKENLNENKPFFAIMSVQPPHNPYWAPEEFMDRYFDESFIPRKLNLRENVPRLPHVLNQVNRDLAGAYAMIENLDWNVGRIIEELKEQNLLESTYIVFFSDHGDMHGSHGHFRKTTPYEESLRIPFIIGGGKMSRPTGNEADVIMNHVDIAPTTLGLCGIPVPDWMQGTDYSYFCTGERKPEAIPESAYIQSVISTGHHDCVDKPWRGIVTREGWKYVCFEDTEWMLFNINKDPYELQNLAHYCANKGIKEELNAKLKNWIEETGDDFSLPDLEKRYADIEESNKISTLKEFLAR